MVTIEWRRLMNDRGQYYYVHIPTDRTQFDAPPNVNFDRYGEQIIPLYPSPNVPSERGLPPSYNASMQSKKGANNPSKPTGYARLPPESSSYQPPQQPQQQQQQQGNSSDYNIDFNFLKPTVNATAPRDRPYPSEYKDDTREMYLNPTIVSKPFDLQREHPSRTITPIDGSNAKHAFNYLLGGNQWILFVFMIVTQIIASITLMRVITYDDEGYEYDESDYDRYFRLLYGYDKHTINLIISTGAFILLYLAALFYIRCDTKRGFGRYVYKNVYHEQGSLLSNRYQTGWDYLTCFIFRNSKYATIREVEQKLLAIDEAEPQLYIAVRGYRNVGVERQSEALSHDYSMMLPSSDMLPITNGFAADREVFTKAYYAHNPDGLGTVYSNLSSHHMNTESFCHMYPINIHAHANVSAPVHTLRDYFVDDITNKFNTDFYLEYRYGYILSPQDTQWLQATCKGLEEWHRNNNVYNPEQFFHIKAEALYILKGVTKRNTDGDYGMDQYNLHCPYYNYGINNYTGCPNSYIWHHAATMPLNTHKDFTDLDKHTGSIPEFTNIITPVDDGVTLTSQPDKYKPGAPQSSPCCCILFNPISFWIQFVLGFFTGGDLMFGFMLRLCGGGRRYMNVVHKKQLQLSPYQIVMPNGMNFDASCQVFNNHGTPQANVIADSVNQSIGSPMFAETSIDALSPTTSSPTPTSSVESHYASSEAAEDDQLIPE